MCHLRPGGATPSRELGFQVATEPTRDAVQFGTSLIIRFERKHSPKLLMALQPLS
jgi:hypothetical protein